MKLEQVYDADAVLSEFVKYQNKYGANQARKLALYIIERSYDRQTKNQQAKP